MEVFFAFEAMQYILRCSLLSVTNYRFTLLSDTFDGV